MNRESSLQSWLWSGECLLFGTKDPDLIKKNPIQSGRSRVARDIVEMRSTTTCPGGQAIVVMICKGNLNRRQKKNPPTAFGARTRRRQVTLAYQCSPQTFITTSCPRRACLTSPLFFLVLVVQRSQRLELPSSVVAILSCPTG